MAWRRAIVHLDMDAFYASVEQRDDPRLQGLPLIVGGHPQRGVVLAASYAVRKFGVRSAMPMVQALRLCPQAKVVPPRFAAYAAVSDAVQAILAEVTPLIEPLSLDEAFLDVSASQSLFGPPGAIAQRLRRRIAAELALPASAGIAATKFVAKIASDAAKPNGQREVAPQATADFLAPLPLGRLWGVGPKSEAQLQRLGLRTIGDLRARGATWLQARLGAAGAALHALSCGEDDRPVVAGRRAKSVGAEDTFAEDRRDLAELRRALHAQAWRVGQRLRASGERGRVVELKLKLEDFQLVQRQLSLPDPTDDGQTIHRAIVKLLAKAAAELKLGQPGGRAVRLTGVAVSGLDDRRAPAPPPVQPELFPELLPELFAARPSAGTAGRDLSTPAPPSAAGEGDRRRAAVRRDRLNAAIDRLEAKYGGALVVPADLSRKAELEAERSGESELAAPSAAARERRR